MSSGFIHGNTNKKVRLQSGFIMVFKRPPELPEEYLLISFFDNMNDRLYLDPSGGLNMDDKMLMHSGVPREIARLIATTHGLSIREMDKSTGPGESVIEVYKFF